MLNSKWRLIYLGIAMLSVTMICSCGGSSGGAADLNTVSVTATSASTNIDGDVAKVTPIDTNGDGIMDSYTYSIPPRDTDTVNIKSIINTNNGSNSSSIRVESVAVTYVRKTLTANSGTTVPVIPTRVDPIGVIITAGGSADIPVTVVTQEIKDLYASTLIVSGDIYAYDVNLTFNIVEVSTGKTGTVNTSLVVRIANFADA